MMLDNWSRWTGGASAPRRVSWECCSLFIATRRTLRARGRKFWESVYRTVSMGDAMQPRPPWEYMWPSLVDEKGTEKIAQGLC